MLFYYLSALLQVIVIIKSNQDKHTKHIIIIIIIIIIYSNFQIPPILYSDSKGILLLVFLLFWFNYITVCVMDNYFLRIGNTYVLDYKMGLDIQTERAVFVKKTVSPKNAKIFSDKEKNELDGYLQREDVFFWNKDLLLNKNEIKFISLNEFKSEQYSCPLCGHKANTRNRSGN